MKNRLKVRSPCFFDLPSPAVLSMATMRWSLARRIVALGCVASWILPAVVALAVSAHLAAEHHEQKEHGREAVQRGLERALHGHSHRAETPDHRHDVPAPAPPSASPPAPRVVPLATPTSGPALAAASPAVSSRSCRGAPHLGARPLHRTLCVLLI